MRSWPCLAISCFVALAGCGGGSSGSSLLTDSSADLPITLSNDRLSLTFEQDPALGVRLVSLTQQSEPAYTFRNDPIQPSDHRLWEARLTLADGRSFAVDGRSARSFTVRHDQGPAGETALRFVWQDVRAPLGVAFDVSVLVWIDADEPLSKWTATVDRAPGSAAQGSLDAFDLPIVQIVPPAVPRDGESALQAQFRTRLLVPAIQISERYLAPNLPFALWLRPPTESGQPVEESWIHPGPRQNMQFAALAGVDPTDPGHRRILFVGTEDTSGYVKEHRHQALMSSDENTIRYGWRSTYFPPFGDRTTGRWNELGNSFETPYPAVIGALHAESDAFWYDVAAQYRRFVERVSLGGPPIEENPRLESTRGPTLYTVFVQSRPNETPPGLYARFLEQTHAFQRTFTTAATGPPTTLLQWQNYFDSASPVGNPDCPLGEHVDPGVAEAVRWATERDILVAPYLRPSELAHCLCWMAEFPAAAEAHDRSGRPLGADDTSECASGVAILDYAHPRSHDWFAAHLGRELVRQFGFRGLYLDVFAGSGTRLTYDPPGHPRGHLPHGGDGFTRGKVAAIEAMRDMLRAEHGSKAKTFLVGEATEEYLAGHLDGMGAGQGWLPQHLQRAEPQLLRALASEGWISPPEELDVPIESTDWSPPLWNLVYHEWAPAQRLSIPWTTVGLANGDYYPGEYETPGGMQWFEGLTAEEWVDLLAYTHGQILAAGSKPATLLYDTGFDAPLIQLDDQGQLVVDEERDPTASGWIVVDFARELQGTLQRAHGGRFLLYGRAQRPLPELLDHPTDLTLNPTSVCLETWDGHGNVTYPFLERPHASQPIAKKTVGTQAFDVPRVLHSMWRSPEGELGLVLVNWSGEPARWSGLFRPEWFDWEPDAHYRVLESTSDGREEPIAEGQGEAGLRADDGPAREGELSLGSVAGRSVRVFVLERAR